MMNIILIKVGVVANVAVVVVPMKQKEKNILKKEKMSEEIS